MGGSRPIQLVNIPMYACVGGHGGMITLHDNACLGFLLGDGAICRGYSSRCSLNLHFLPLIR